MTATSTGVSSKEFAGSTASVKAARHWTQEVLHQAAVSEETTDDAVLIVSELATNAVIHTNSRHPNDTYQITLVVHPEAVLIEVIDRGSDRIPAQAHPGDSDDGGRGLLICRHLGTLDHAATNDRCSVQVRLIRPPVGMTGGGRPA